MVDKLDIILFGASGFTGKHTIPILQKLCQTEKSSLTWGIAGRSQKKLSAVLEYYETQTGSPFKNIPIIIADVQDMKSLKEMAKRARIIINCCGPYRFFGEAVVKACIDEGTHHVDVSGEMQFIEEMQLKYHEQAQEKGVYIISACGIESIPIDSGIAYLQQRFNGTLNSVVAYMEYSEEDKSAGPSLNYGTWESAIYTLGHMSELSNIRRQLFPKRLSEFKPKLKTKFIPHKSDLVKGWAAPFDAVDRTVVVRSQRFFHEEESKRPVQVRTYAVLKSFKNLILIAIFGGLFLLLCKFSLGRKLLLKCPERFSFGLVSRENPSEEKVENSRFVFTLYGEGWKEKLANATDQYATPPNRVIAAKVKGRNPGYGATCICLALAAIIVITEQDKLPSMGGVYPPGYAFAKTSIIKKLNENDVSVDILWEKDL